MNWRYSIAKGRGCRCFLKHREHSDVEKRSHFLLNRLCTWYNKGFCTTLS